MLHAVIVVWCVYPLCWLSFCRHSYQPIVGVRYQCAHCPSLPIPFSLVSTPIILLGHTYTLSFLRISAPTANLAPIFSTIQCISSSSFLDPYSIRLNPTFHYWLCCEILLWFPALLRCWLCIVTEFLQAHPLIWLTQTILEVRSHKAQSTWYFFWKGNSLAYLKQLKHDSAICDRCMDRIQGEWFHCVYCPQDLCETCEALDTHDDTHFFVVFKSDMNMSEFRWI